MIMAPFRRCREILYKIFLKEPWNWFLSSVHLIKAPSGTGAVLSRFEVSPASHILAECISSFSVVST